MTNTVGIVIPHPLRERAKDLRINISAICRVALADEVKKVENDEGRRANLPQNDSEPSTALLIEVGAK